MAKRPIDKSFLRTQLIDYNDTIINPQLEKLDASIKKNATDIANFSHGTSKVAAAHHADSATADDNGNKIIDTYATKNELSAHIQDTENPHKVTQAQVGLSNVDNTSDMNKPVSTAQKTAINTAESNAKTYTDTQIANLIDGAPTTMDTLKEIADAMTNNKNVVDALNTSIGTKADKSVVEAHITDTNNPHAVTKTQIGLDKVDNTADSEKSVKYAAAAGSATKATSDSAGNKIVDTYATKTEVATVQTTLEDKIDDIVGVPTTYKTLESLEDAILAHKTVTDKLSTAIGNKVDKVTGKGLSSNDFTDTLKQKLENLSELGEANQNAFSTIAVGTDKITADSVTDTVNFASGDNVTLEVDKTTKTVTINAKDTTYTALKNPYGLTLQNEDKTTLVSYDGSAAKTLVLTPSLLGAATDDHTHKYAGSKSAGGDATAALKLTCGTVGNAKQPVYFKDGVPLVGGYTLGDACTKGIYNIVSVGALSYDSATASGLVPTINTLAHWNGAYNSSGTSNLVYCNKGAFGTMATQNASDYQKVQLASFSGNGDSKEYCLVCTLKIASTYINHPMEITLRERGRNTIVRLEILFNSINTADPTLNSFYVNGRSNDYYIYKSATSTWQVYAKKNESYSGITVHGYIGYTGVSVTWNMTNADLPSGATKASLMFATTNTTYSAATTSAAGLMSASDKKKLDGIATGANKTTVDSALSSTSTNPVQNKVINTALAGKAASSHTHNYAGASSPGGNATNANNAYKLSCTPSARPSSANLTADGSGSMITFKASSNMTKGAPSKGDGHILHFYWDNTSGWDNQLAVAHDGGVEYRCMNNGTWKDWVTLLDSNMVKSASAVTHSGWGANNDYVPDMSFIAYWNGAHNSSNASNLAYCKKGAFGDAAIKGVSTSVAKNDANLITSGAVYKAINGGSFAFNGGTITQDLTISKATPVLSLSGTDISESMIELKRKTGSQWRIVNSSGYLRFQNNCLGGTEQSSYQNFVEMQNEAKEFVVHGKVAAINGFRGGLDGVAKQATILETTHYIDGVGFNGSTDIIHYGTCRTDAKVVDKVVDIPGFQLVTGASVKVKFTVTNSASYPKLNVNSTGAKLIKYRNFAISASVLSANKVYEFVYDGSAWILVGDVDTTNYLPLTGGTMSGVVEMIKSDTSPLYFMVKNKLHEGKIVVNSDGDFGIWSDTNRTHLITLNKDGSKLHLGMTSRDIGYVPTYAGTIYENGTALSSKYAPLSHSHSNYMPVTPSYIELHPSSGVGHGGYIDFHFNGSTTDFTSRIIESSAGLVYINSVYFSGTTVGGNATGVVDYGDGSRHIKIGYAGNGLTSGEVGCVAGYVATTDGTIKIKDISKTELQKWLECTTVQKKALSGSGSATFTVKVGSIIIVSGTNATGGTTRHLLIAHVSGSGTLSEIYKSNSNIAVGLSLSGLTLTVGCGTSNGAQITILG